MMRMTALAVLVLTLSVILLSAAGIYAMMSFTVARRRREIGIRAALGAPPALLLGAVFTRAAKQLAAGVAIGLALAAAADLQLEGGYTALLAPVAALMLTGRDARRCRTGPARAAHPGDGGAARGLTAIGVGCSIGSIRNRPLIRRPCSLGLKALDPREFARGALVAIVRPRGGRRHWCAVNFAPPPIPGALGQYSHAYTP